MGNTHRANRNAYSVFMGKPKGKLPVGRSTLRREDNIKIDLREIGWTADSYLKLRLKYVEFCISICHSSMALKAYGGRSSRAV
jgi:hypothetical protein